MLSLISVQLVQTGALRQNWVADASFLSLFVFSTQLASSAYRERKADKKMLTSNSQIDFHTAYEISKLQVSLIDVQEKTGQQ